ncbi:MAG: GDSL-type esterase/lipase family protein [Caulobacterales bacterium]
MKIWGAIAACISLAACATSAPFTPSPPITARPLPTGRFATAIAKFEDMDRTSPPALCQYLFVGSSSIQFWSTLAEDFAPRPALNRGIGGTQVTDVYENFDLLVTQYQPRAIVFYAGDNDLALGAPAPIVVENFQRMMAAKSRALGDTPVYVISVKPSRNRLGQLADQAEVNRGLAALADSRADLVFINVVPLMMPNGQLLDVFMPDGLHLNQAGYAIWRDAVRAALDAPIAVSAPGCAPVA